MAKTPVPTAKEINEAHQFAKECAETAIEHAIRCGQLLQRKKDELGHGAFGEWVETYCKFSYRSARSYMQAADKAAQNGSALPFSSVRHALEHDKPKPSAPNTPQKGVVSVVKAPAAPEATEETAAEPPATPERETAPASGVPAPGAAEDEPARPEWEPSDDEVLAETERQIAASTDKVMAADDKLAAAHAEIKRQAAEIAVLKLSRDGAMNARSMAIQQLEAAQRKVARLEKELEKVRGRKAA